MAVEFSGEDATRTKRVGWSVLAAGALAVAFPLSLAFAQEPPQPNAAPRNAVERGAQVKKGDVPPAKDVPDSELAPKPGDEAPAAAEGDAANKADGEQNAIAGRGQRRGEMLKKLFGDSNVALEKDPGNPPSVTEPLTIEESVAFTLKNNFEVQGAKSKTEAAKWDKYSAYGGYLPKVTLEVRDGKQESKPSNYSIKGASGNMTVPDDTHHTWSNSLTINQPVVDLSIISDILTKSDTADAVEADEYSAREKAAYDTIASFLRVTRSRMIIAFAESYKQNLDKLGQRMRDRVSGGGAPGVELDRINARSVSAKSAIIEAHSEYQAAIVEFRRLTGVNPIKLHLPDTLLPAVPGSVEEVLTRTMRNNPDFRAANKRAEASIGDMEKSFSNLLPKFGVEFSNSRVWNAGGVSKTDVNTCTGNVNNNCFFPNSKTTSLMGVFTWNLNGGSDFASGMSNRARAQAASFAATDLRQKLDETVRVSFDAMNAANARIEAVSRAVESNSKVATAFEEQYLAGSRQLLDLLDAYERLYQSQNELTVLLVSEAQAGYQLRRQMGELERAIMSPETLN